MIHKPIAGQIVGKAQPQVCLPQNLGNSAPPGDLGPSREMALAGWTALKASTFPPFTQGTHLMHSDMCQTRVAVPSCHLHTHLTSQATRKGGPHVML